MERAGFEDVHYRLLGGGIVALHVGSKPSAGS
jgi:ubiquinone/menaquinone biosynthesis C-methylase UbiE